MCQNRKKFQLAGENGYILSLICIILIGALGKNALHRFYGNFNLPVDTRRLRTGKIY